MAQHVGHVVTTICPPHTRKCVEGNLKTQHLHNYVVLGPGFTIALLVCRSSKQLHFYFAEVVNIVGQRVWNSLEALDFKGQLEPSRELELWVCFKNELLHP